MNDDAVSAQHPFGIFINYRREDAAGHAGRMYDILAERFGKDRLFMDVDTIDPGEDFGEAIDRAVGSSRVLIVLIGRRWSSVTDLNGRRRLDNPDDFVRLEIEAALQKDVKVIPVLVQKAEMPGSDELPKPLSPLARRHAIEVSDERFHYDTRRLIRRIEELERTLRQTGPETHDGQAAKPARRRMRRIMIPLAVLAVVLVGAAVTVLELSSDDLLMPAAVTASSTDQPGVDTCGTPVPFDASRVSDGDPVTAWRTPGNGRGERIQLAFAEPVRITRVGLIPGYAKVDPCNGMDRFHQNRIVERVRYVFSGGSSVEQELEPIRELQFVEVDVVTDVVTVRILETRPPGGGEDFNNTVISEIEVYGDPSP
jgi:hypothetical protein